MALQELGENLKGFGEETSLSLHSPLDGYIPNYPFPTGYIPNNPFPIISLITHSPLDISLITHFVNTIIIILRVL